MSAPAIDHDPQAQTLDDRLAECVLVDPNRLGGEPVFKGTRVPVKALFEYLKAGDPLATFLDDFAGVTREQAESVIELAGQRLRQGLRRP